MAVFFLMLLGAAAGTVQQEDALRETLLQNYNKNTRPYTEGPVTVKPHLARAALARPRLQRNGILIL